MRLLLTVVPVGSVRPDGSAPVAGVARPEDRLDLALEIDAGLTVRQLAAVLGRELTAAEPDPGPVPGGLRLVPAAGAHPPKPAPAVAPSLWLDGRLLDPEQLLLESPVRQGAVLGVGGPLPDVLAEPQGLVEVRVAAGPGAGTVHRLGVGSAAIGASPQCPVPLPQPGLPAVCAWVDVTAAGEVTLRPDQAVAGVHRPAPVRSQPAAGPIVVPREISTPRRRRVRWWPQRWRRWRSDPDGGLPHTDLDPQADVPLVHVEREALDQPRRWPAGAALVVGDAVLELSPVEPPDASLSPTPGALVRDYNRPPRLLPARRRTGFSLPAEPTRPDRTPIPLLLVIAPLFMSLALFWFTRSPYSLIFAIFSPMMAISNVTSSRRQATLRYREQITEYHRRTRAIRTEAYQALLAERSARRRDLPDPAALLLMATGPRARLWERRPTDSDWLLLRFGSADLASEVTLRDPRREEHQGPLTWTAPDVPVGVDLAAAGVVGIAGPAEIRRGAARWALAQAATLHSPADLEIVVLGNRDSGGDWGWVRWLPHARTDDTGIGAALTRVGAEPEDVADRIGELLDLVQTRRRARTERRAPAGGGRQVLVVLDGARRIRLLPGVISLLQEGPAEGIRFVCLDDDVRQLPEECRAVVHPPELDHSDGRGLRLEVLVTGEASVEAVRPDGVSAGWCERLARCLAPVRDVSAEDLAGSLPAASRLVDVLAATGAGTSAAAISAGWRHRPRSTVAVIGEGTDGPFAVDVRRDGPHALIAGTTGSGKSELLQTLIASLAVANRPDELTFVLIDYKGGAAFKDCTDLPHTVGMVTDLDGHLTTRALESLAAELRRREHQLARAGAKDIEDYTSARGLPGGPDDPMARLVLVIDEFAALVAELPDFVSGLVDIARRGRSLGVHLVLATQRPAGVVSAEIRSNTPLRIALRVTDPQDSQDVIESSDAAAISKAVPGRAYARLGHSSLTPFQSARVGGRPPGAGGAATRVRPLAWAQLGGPFGSTGPNGLNGRGDDGENVAVATDLETLVLALREATRLSGASPPASPWLPPLAPVLTLDDVAQLPEQATAGAASVWDRVRPIRFGVADLPDEQRQAAAQLALGGGHLAVIGGPRSGRSTVLRTIAGAIGTSCSPDDVHLYGVDAGGNALLPVVSLPHTGAVVSRDQPDRVARLTGRLVAEVARRQQLLAEHGFADLREQRAAVVPDQRLPHLVVLLDRWEAFVSTFESFDSGVLVDRWLGLLQEGPGVGLTVVLTCDRTGLAGRIGALVDDKLVLRLTDPGDFAAIGLPLGQVPTELSAGRGFRAEGVREVQVALLDADPIGPAQVAALQAIGRQAVELAGPRPGHRRPFRVDVLPARIRLDEALGMAEQPLTGSELGLAVGGDALALRCLDLVAHGPGVIVAGPRRTGRSTTLAVLARQAAARGWRLGLVTPRISPLRELAGELDLPWWGPDSPRPEATTGIGALAPGTGVTPSLLLIDDLELLGTDGWLADAVTDHLAGLRDTGCGVVAAGTLDELGGAYRGPIVALKKSRTGLLLSPAAPNDGDLFGVRLPRAALGGGPAGRGVLVAAGQAESVQVPWPG